MLRSYFETAITTPIRGSRFVPVWRWPIYKSPVVLKAPLTSCSLNHPVSFRFLNGFTQKRCKTSTSVFVDDLPQGLVSIEPLALERDDPVYPTVAQQARDHMNKFDNCILLTRVGGFYELYFEHAEELGPLLNLKVASRKPTNAPAFAMAGFPFFQLDRYLKILVQDLNRYVAIAEEFSNAASAKVKTGGLINDRRVTRIITPGTLIDETFMDPLAHNYVLAVHVKYTATDASAQASEPGVASILSNSSTRIGLAWLDLSTGHFYTCSTTLTALPSYVARISPKEIVLDKVFQGLSDHLALMGLADENCLLTYTKPTVLMSMNDWASWLESPIPPTKIPEFSADEIGAGSSLLQYVKARMPGSDMMIQPPIRQLEVMGIDKNTMRALEIRKTMREDVITGSLLHTMRRTVTKGGGRLLDTWISMILRTLRRQQSLMQTGSPSTSLTVINSRLDIVSHLLKNPSIRERITTLLNRTHDSHRLLQKFAFGRGDPDDLLALANTILATHDISKVMEAHDPTMDLFQPLATRIDLNDPLSLAEKIRQAIDEEGLVEQHHLTEDEEGELQKFAQAVLSASSAQADAGSIPKSAPTKPQKRLGLRDYNSEDNDAWTMKPIASPTLLKLHKELSILIQDKNRLGRELCSQLGAASLTLRFTPGLGHICHVKGKDTKLDSLLSSSIRNVGSSKSTRSFHHTAWTALGNKIIEHKARIRGEESRVFNSLRQAVIHNIIKLRCNASVLDELDIACSFALLAQEKNWVRPVLNEGTAHNVIGGRHPTVEGGLEREGRTFVTNDCTVGSPTTTWLITGPNMAGKSTFLRQNALITILAQVGSYVPASFADIGIVDHIFSRVGSADNLYNDQSTFMVEMLETANILKRATGRSFVIMDEIGRGTTAEDGTAVAFACLWHLTRVNTCRTLFATHFHSLVDMIKHEGMQGEVAFRCTDVEEGASGQFRYVHKLRDGINRKSHALKVAILAGLPQKAVDVAQQALGKELSYHENVHRAAG